jgi:hypothetical protein
MAEITALEAWLRTQKGGTAEEQAHWAAAIDEIERFRKDPASFAAPAPLATPPGQPIGSVESIGSTDEEDDFQVF